MRLGVGALWRACLVPALLFSRSTPANCRLLLLPPSTGSPAGIYTAFADDHKITVADLNTGEVLSTHNIEPNKTYWRNQHKQPGRWPSS